ncbi:MAG: tRNA epoxyqueuosine(34) reductase QueG [Elusimicrobia bacterium RIFOXYA2_FULL_58_8]|nr:MAG: tRNA epoxyqueuosine(34) reductase QueG [Elusimicrobia bacterium RIFOXYA2_FULL_58_8]OGS12731.1 MAG: tRNA epoxyqueuosine(34) reductase QueG [Elusimicrobia bacterium RIFOXYA12_FULL_57_11]
MKSASQAAARFKAIALECGASACGVAAAGDLAEFGRFAAAAGAAPAGLAYLNREPLKRKNIGNWCPGAASALVCAFSYWAPERDYAAALSGVGAPAAYLKSSGRKVHQPELTDAPGAKISRYALDRDYHLIVREKLGRILEALKKEFPGTEGKLFCDTAPVMEKELARLAGLGFRGKNTLVVSPELGSWFFIGGLALNAALEPDRPCGGECGSCDRCVAACPAGALAGGALDAGRCLSYWTTQAKEKIPEPLARLSGGWVYGCDICQEVCPYNEEPR